MPRLRKTVRVSDARRPVAVVPRLPRRRPAEAALGIRGAVEQPRQIVQVDAAGAVRLVRRSARPRVVQHELTASPFVRAFRHRNYRLFFGGQLISLTGTWMQSVAESWLVFRLTGSSALLGVSSFASPPPGVLFAPGGGTVAARPHPPPILRLTPAPA